jgi:hypothetical protein
MIECTRRDPSGREAHVSSPRSHQWPALEPVASSDRLLQRKIAPGGLKRRSNLRRYGGHFYRWVAFSEIANRARKARPGFWAKVTFHFFDEAQWESDRALGEPTTRGVLEHEGVRFAGLRKLLGSSGDGPAQGDRREEGGDVRV